MKYKYIPDNYNSEKINNNFSSEEEFIRYQKLYRESFETILKKYIDFNKFKNLTNNPSLDIPKIDDGEYNIYRKFSTLDNDYLYIRNNFYVENLTDEEKQILDNGSADIKFINNTMGRVMYNSGDYIFAGSPVLDNMVSTKSIIFEFSYNQLQVRDVEKLMAIRNVAKVIFEMLEKEIKSIGLNFDGVIYTGISNIYITQNEEEKKIITKDIFL